MLFFSLYNEYEGIIIMRRKINVINVVLSIFVLGLYVFNMISKGNNLIRDYSINYLYLGAGIGVCLLMLSLFKMLRDGMWMDLIYILFLGMFIGFNIFGNVQGKSLNIHAVFFCFTRYTIYIIGVLLFANLITFITSFKD